MRYCTVLILRYDEISVYNSFFHKSRIVSSGELDDNCRAARVRNDSERAKGQFRKAPRGATKVPLRRLRNLLRYECSDRSPTNEGESVDESGRCTRVPEWE